jgi:hypothetical protein
MNKLLLNGSDEVRKKAKRVILKCDPALIADVHSIVESCFYIAVVRTLEPDMGIVELISSCDTFEDTLKVSKSLQKLIGAEILHPRQKSV